MDVYSLGKAAKCNKQNARECEKLDSGRDAVCVKLEQKSLIPTFIVQTGGQGKR